MVVDAAFVATGYVRNAHEDMLKNTRHLLRDGYQENGTRFPIRRDYKIDFDEALKQNLLGILGGDFSYRLVPGTQINLQIQKLNTPDPDTGGFDGQITEAVTPSFSRDGKRVAFNYWTGSLAPGGGNGSDD